MVILSIQLDKYIVKTNGNLIRANKKNCANYEEQGHSNLLSNLKEQT